MDDQNQNQSYGNEQNGGDGSGSNYYQDYTADAQQYQAPPLKDGSGRPNGLQIAGFVLGVLALPGCCCYGILGILLGIVGMILAIAGNRRNRGCGIGVAGLVCSVIGIVFGIIATIYFVVIIMGLYGYGPLADMIRELGYGMSMP